MNKLLTAFSILASVLTLNSCSKNEPSFADYWKTWGDEHISNWNYNAEIYDKQVNVYCNNSEQGSREAIQSSLLALSNQFASLNGFPYHAITDFNLNFELYAWPDKRNMTEARLSQRVNNGGITESELNMATAPEKGLLALEWLSFTEDMSKEKICSTLPAVSGHYRKNIAKIAEYHLDNPLIETEWMEEKDSYEGKSIALNLLFQQVAQISNRLRTSIDEQGHVVEILSEGWRSESTIEIYTVSLISLISHLNAVKERADISVNSEGLLDQQLDTLDTLLKKMQTAIKSQADSPDELKQEPFSDWLQLQQTIVDTEQLIEGPIAQDIGVLIGFNNYDGD